MLCPMSHPVRAMLIFAAAAACGLDAGCSRDPRNLPPDPAVVSAYPAFLVTVPPGDYAAAFERARTYLRELGFVLNRVDAQAGIINTEAKGTAGIGTPWDSEVSTLGQGLETFAERDKRVVSVTFTPGSGGSVEDLRQFQGPVRVEVSTAVYRWQTSNWRLDVNAVADSSYAYDPMLAERGMINYGVAREQDPLLSERVARAVSGSAPAR